MEECVKLPIESKQYFQANVKRIFEIWDNIKMKSVHPAYAFMKLMYVISRERQQEITSGREYLRALLQ